LAVRRSGNSRADRQAVPRRPDRRVAGSVAHRRAPRRLLRAGLPRLLRHRAAARASRRMNVRHLTHLWSPQLRNRRPVDVYLPPSYSAGRDRYPVVYMQDGQNLSDPETAFAGTWELGSAIDELAHRGIEAIIVGIHHAGERRLAEYTPVAARTDRDR